MCIRDRDHIVALHGRQHDHGYQYNREHQQAAVQSDDVIHLLYFRGAFDETSLHLTSTAFLFYVVGVLGFAWRNFLTRVFYAVQDTSAPMKIGVVSVAVNILLDIWLAKVMGVGGLTLATSISGMVGAMLMLIRLRRKVGRMGFRDTCLL